MNNDLIDGKEDHFLMKVKNLLIVGASGFVGRCLVEALSHDSRFYVTALVRSKRKASWLPASCNRLVVEGLSSKDCVGRVVAGQDLVINLAYDFKQTKQHNVRNFRHLVDACIENGIEHLIHVSSAVVYDGWPDQDINEDGACSCSGSEYKQAKVEMENILLDDSICNEVARTIIQPTIIYGPYRWLWTDYVVERLLTGVLLLPEESKGLCNAVYVSDVVDALVQSALNPSVNCEKYIISGPECVTWREFFEAYNRYLGTDSIQYFEPPLSSPASVDGVSQSKRALTNPFLLAEWWGVKQWVGHVERVLGPDVIYRIKNWLRALKRRRGQIVYSPSPSDIHLYKAQGRCFIDKAKRNLGYEPKVDFEKGIHLTASYIDDVLLGRYKS